MYQCPECEFSIDGARGCPDCFEACPVCGAEMEEQYS